MTIVNMVIKGSKVEAFEALSKRGIDARFVNEVKGTTVCEATLFDVTPVILWSTELVGKVIPPGTLLNYTEEACDEREVA